MNKTLITIALAGTFLAFPAMALDLQDARRQGAVGEKPNGYVAAIKNSPEVEALVKDINDKRKTEYQKISGENGQSAEVVGKIAAGQIIGNLEAGSMYQDVSGQWKKK
jgi:uncharacterized protein YdbL (DUF1318 family)